MINQLKENGKYASHRKKKLNFYRNSNARDFLLLWKFTHNMKKYDKKKKYSCTHHLLWFSIWFRNKHTDFWSRFNQRTFFLFFFFFIRVYRNMPITYMCVFFILLANGFNYQKIDLCYCCLISFAVANTRIWIYTIKPSAKQMKREAGEREKERKRENEKKKVVHMNVWDSLFAIENLTKAKKI